MGFSFFFSLSFRLPARRQQAAAENEALVGKGAKVLEVLLTTNTVLHSILCAAHVLSIFSLIVAIACAPKQAAAVTRVEKEVKEAKVLSGTHESRNSQINHTLT